MKILFVEDDDLTSEVVSATLGAHHYAVDVVRDGETGLEMATQWNYDLILLDVLLPKLNGIEVCRKLRSRACQTPILVLTHKGSSEDIIAGLDAGADDYVIKSIDTSQLLARVRALLRRRGEGVASPLLTWGQLHLDPAAALVTWDETVVPCRPKEYTLLELFLRHPHRLLSRTCIIDHLWPFDDAPVEGSVTTLIKDLRRRLKAAGMTQDPIETVYGLGYRLKPVPDAEPQVDQTDHGPEGASSPGATAKDSPEQRLQGVIQQVEVKFRASLDQRLAVLTAMEQGFQAGDWSLHHQQTALDHIHKLAGGLGTFGHGNASAVAEALEQSLNQQINQENSGPTSFRNCWGSCRRSWPDYHPRRRRLSQRGEGKKGKCCLRSVSEGEVLSVELGELVWGLRFTVHG
ncbi:MAG: response regulator [Leptolyngbyaceae cyanobacterium SM2_3_12]|nr:response regulator [Leptolyngbyaceae cyanobacterium SM2_3_12]